MTTAIREQKLEFAWNETAKEYRHVFETVPLNSINTIAPLNRGMTRPAMSSWWASADSPAMSSLMDGKDGILRSVNWYSMLFGRDRVNGTPTTIVCHLLDLTPVVQIALMKPRYYRTAMLREAYLFQVFGINPDKVWRKMDDHRFREEITNALNTMLAMKRLGIEHEGFEAAVQAWVKRNS